MTFSHQWFHTSIISPAFFSPPQSSKPMSKQRDAFKNSIGDQFIMILKFQAVIKMADIVFSVRLNPLSLHLVKCVILS